MPKPVEFWFEFASTYSYLSAMRLPDLAAQAGTAVRWRPFLLGPIFAAQGWNTSPFNIYAAKGNYMWRDMERRTARLGLTFHRPATFPQNGLQAARVMMAAPEGPQAVAFCQNVYLAQFDANQDISDPDVIAACAGAAQLPGAVLDRARDDDVRHALRSNTEEATRRGIFGAPAFLIGEELFWGDDRLEEALDWATRDDR